MSMDKHRALTADEVLAFDEINAHHNSMFELDEEHVLDSSLLLMIHDS